jgi:hypothetical protein
VPPLPIRKRRPARKGDHVDRARSEERIEVVAADLDPEQLPVELPDELIDELLAGAWTPEEITGSDGLLSRLTKRLVEREMEAELSEHLGYERGQAPPRDNCYTGRPAAERAQKSRSPVTFRSSGFD